MKQTKVMVKHPKLDSIKNKMGHTTYSKTVDECIDFAFENYDRKIKNEAMEIIDIVTSNIISTELKPVHDYISRVENIFKLHRKNDGIIMQELENILMLLK